MTTILGDRLKAEKTLGPSFATSWTDPYNFFDRATRWRSMAEDWNPNYLLRKAEDLIEPVEDGRGLNIILPVVPQASSFTASSKKSEGGSTPAKPVAKKPKKTGQKCRIDTQGRQAHQRRYEGIMAASHRKHLHLAFRSADAGRQRMATFHGQSNGLKTQPIPSRTHVRAIPKRRRMRNHVHTWYPHQGLLLHRFGIRQSGQTIRRDLPLRLRVTGIPCPGYR